MRPIEIRQRRICGGIILSSLIFIAIYKNKNNKQSNHGHPGDLNSRDSFSMLDWKTESGRHDVEHLTLVPTNSTAIIDLVRCSFTWIICIIDLRHIYNRSSFV